MTFKEPGLDARMVSRLDAKGLTRPTPIQEKSIPPALQGREVLGICTADEVTELNVIERVLGTRVDIEGRPRDAMHGASKPRRERRTRQHPAGRPDRLVA